MTKRAVLPIAVLIVVALSASIGASGADKKVRLKDVPPAVQNAIKEQTKGATIVGLSEEREAGTVFYEVETTVSGRTRDLLLDSAGGVVELEEEVTLDSVPAAVRTAFAAAGRVRKVEAVTKGTTVTYEADVEAAGKRSEVIVDAHGRTVSKK